MQAQGIEGRAHVAHPRHLIVRRPEIRLPEFFHANLPRALFIRQVRERHQAEQLVYKFDNRAVLRGHVRDAMRHRVGRDDNRWNARPLLQRQPGLIIGAYARLRMVIQPV